MADRTVDAIKARVSLDHSDLAKAEAAAQKAGDGIKSGMTTATTHTLRAKESFTTLMQHVEKLPPVVGQAARSIESMASSGASGFSLVGMGAAAAAAAVLAFAEESIHKYEELGESVHAYMRVTGESAAAAGAQVQAFKELGVSEDVAQAAMVKLSKAIEGTPKKLEALGIEVAHNAKGNVDLGETLYNIIDAWNGTEDAARRNAIVLTAFGKAGAGLIPIMQAGSAGLRQLEADVRVTFTDADIEAIHRYHLQQLQVKASTDAVGESIGQKLLPAQAALTSSYLENEYANKRLDEARKNGTIGVNASRGSIAALAAEYRKEFEAGQVAKEKLAELTDAHRAAAEAVAAQAKALDDLVNSEEASTNAGIALERANLHLAESAGKVDKAQDALNKVVQQYGPASEEAQAAGQALAGVLLDQKQSYIDAAAAAQKLAEDQAGPDASATDKAALGHAAYIAKLQEEANSLAPGSPLRVYLEQYIARLAAIPAAVQTEVSLHGSAFTGGGGGNQRASGGPMVPGRTYTVGEDAPETVVMGANGGAMVIPNAGGARDGGGATYHLTLVGTPVVNDPDGVRRMLQRMSALGAAQ